ncbi:ubiquitin-conjugating enzyme e2 h [Anaeramoeba ignava]|uniref:Ubiquitin-conjugating enzyme E2 H n=1 Tax=Anaeramoeba ignava TaxID=1746090 RepID=A0A9Q0LT56_ANAIG|nr:ubiquitin-conjugating enzyme e2 h [Anaeramoeba ignava]
MTTESIKRKQKDVMRLIKNGFKLEFETESDISTFYVNLTGPKESPYEKGTWKVRVHLPDSYPYKSPSIGFLNKIFHPNIDFQSGSVCLNVINQAWSPMFDLQNIFDIFLPQLLLYPNPNDPLNHEAAILLKKNPEQYNRLVQENVRKFAIVIIDKKKELAKGENTKSNLNDDDSDDISDISDVSNLSDLSDLDDDDNFSDSFYDSKN